MTSPARTAIKTIFTVAAVCASAGAASAQQSAAPNQAAPLPAATASRGLPAFQGPTSPIVDVALTEEGIVRGHAVDEQGKPVDGALVIIRQNNEVVQKLVTDTKGQFAADGLRAGVYSFSTVQGSSLYRLWPKNIAPPSARPHALIKVGRPVLRAQFGGASGLTQLTTMALAGGALGVGIVSLDKIDDIENDVQPPQSP